MWYRWKIYKQKRKSRRLSNYNQENNNKKQTSDIIEYKQNINKIQSSSPPFFLLRPAKQDQKVIPPLTTPFPKSQKHMPGSPAASSGLLSFSHSLFRHIIRRPRFSDLLLRTSKPFLLSSPLFLLLDHMSTKTLRAFYFSYQFSFLEVHFRGVEKIV